MNNTDDAVSVALEKSNLGSLRSVQHKDQFGNAISRSIRWGDGCLMTDEPAEPDLSNPTRPRFERPLDTIRSFEAAIYGTYNKDRPLSFARTGIPFNWLFRITALTISDDAGEYSRGSYYGGMTPLFTIFGTDDQGT